MYPTDNFKHGPIKLNQFVNQKSLESTIMLKTIQNLCYNKTNGHNFNMTSPFLVDNILHQQKATTFHNQYLNQQLESYVLNRQAYDRNSRENTPETDETKLAEHEYEETRQEDNSSKLENDEDSKISKEEEEQQSYSNIKPEFFRNDEFYGKTYEEIREKEVLNIPVISRNCSNCGSYECSPFACKKSGLKRLEELEKRFNLNNYQDNSGDEAVERSEERKFITEDIVKSCDDYSEAGKTKPLLKFSVSAILGDREDRNSAEKSNGVIGKTFFIYTII